MAIKSLCLLIKLLLLCVLHISENKVFISFLSYSNTSIIRLFLTYPGFRNYTVSQKNVCIITDK